MNLLIMNILYKSDHATWGLCIWLLSLSMCSRFVHVLVCVSTLFIFMSGYTTFFVCLFIHSSADKYLNCFYLLAIVSSSATNIFGKVLVGTLFFSSFRYKLRSWIASSYDDCMFNLLRNCQTSSWHCKELDTTEWLTHTHTHTHHNCTIFISSSNVWGFQLLYILANTLFFLSFFNSYPNPCELAFVVALVCISIMTNEIEHIFMCFLAIYISLETYQIFCPF